MQSVNFFQIEEAKDVSKPTLKLVEDKCVQNNPINLYGITEVKEEHEPETNIRQISDYKTKKTLEFTASAQPIKFLKISREKDDQNSETSQKCTSTPTVMIVDDDSVISGFLEHLFKKNGYEPIMAKNGRVALDMLETMLPPDLIIMDIMLPFVDGYQLLKRIRANEEWSQVPIVMLTSKGREQDVVRAFESGANDYLIKPFQSEELMARAGRFVR